MLKIICAMLWMSAIPLGRLAPYVLGGMIGRRPHKGKSNERSNDMSCSSSGGKPLTTRRHIDENKRLETSSEVSHEDEGEKGTKNLGNAQSSVSR